MDLRQTHALNAVRLCYEQVTQIGMIDQLGTVADTAEIRRKVFEDEEPPADTPHGGSGAEHVEDEHEVSLTRFCNL